MCQKLEKILITRWHPRNLEIVSGMPNLKTLVLFDFNPSVDTLVTFFRKLSLRKIETLSIQYIPNAKEEFFVELSKLDFPMLKKLSFYQTWIDKIDASNNLTNNTFQTLVSKCPNLKFIYFGDNFGGSYLSNKKLMEIFEKRNIFILFAQTRDQISMERWFQKQDKNVYENYQKLKPMYLDVKSYY